MSNCHFDLDGSETSWLVYADWLEDQGFDAAHIRMPIEIPIWYFVNDIGSWQVGTRACVGNNVGGYWMDSEGNRVGVHASNFFDIGVGGGLWERLY
jgi:hypothetical protein